MKNQGISLISLIITIIVIIILAAIVIFSGMDTPERAQLAGFSQDVANVSAALTDQLTDASTTFNTNKQTRNTEQTYYYLATGLDSSQYGYMMGTEIYKSGDTKAKKDEAAPYNCQNILQNTKREADAKKLNTTLPKVREHDEAWYVTADGKVFNATGFVSGGKTYFTADLYTNAELTVDPGTQEYEDRAKIIAKELMAGTSGAITVAN